MPNTLTNVHDIKVAQRALQPFTAALTPMRAFSTNFSLDPADKLDTVRVPIVSPPSQSSDFADKLAHRAYTALSGSEDVAPLVLADVLIDGAHVLTTEVGK